MEAGLTIIYDPTALRYPVQDHTETGIAGRLKHIMRKQTPVLENTREPTSLSLRYYCGRNGTSEIAEWLALLLALRVGLNLGLMSLNLYGDCKSIIQQACDATTPRVPVRDYKISFINMAKQFDQLEVYFVKRYLNLAGRLLEFGPDSPELKFGLMSLEGVEV